MLRSALQRLFTSTILKANAGNGSSGLMAKNMGSRFFRISAPIFKEDANSGGDEIDPTDEAGTPIGFRLPFDADAAPRQLERREYTKHKPNLFRISPPVIANKSEREGTVGEDTLLSLNTSEVDQYLPTIQTMSQLFDGTPFSQLPICHIKATRNNTIMHVFDPITLRAIMYTSARKEGFKHCKKKTSLAGQTTGAAAGHKLLRRGVRTIRVAVKGLGPGRMTSVRGLVGAGVNVVSITDYTPLPELGPKPRKVRRL